MIADLVGLDWTFSWVGDFLGRRFGWVAHLSRFLWGWRFDWVGMDWRLLIFCWTDDLVEFCWTYVRV